MIEIALKFQYIATLAVRSDYSRSDLFDNNLSLRLATVAVNRGKEFADMMETKGYIFHFNSDQKGDFSEYSVFDVRAIEKLSITSDNAVEVRTVPDHPDVEDIVHNGTSLPKPRDGSISGWLKTVYHQSRRFELRTFDTSLLAVTMR